MIDDTRYPIGRFVPPVAWDAADINGWRKDIAGHPALLRAAIAGLDDRQLDTPYREGGWTVRQVVHHLGDSHVNAWCRFKLALTESNPTIKPYQEALWSELADGVSGPLGPTLQILDGLHARWTRLLDGFTDADWHRTFTHPEHTAPFTLGRTAAMYSWHGKHHTAHIDGLRQREGWS